MRRLSLIALVLLTGIAPSQETRKYANRLTPIKDPKPLLADHPEFVEPIKEEARFEAPLLVDDEGADLHVRAWRFSYNARGIIEMPNRLRAAETALIVVHPWGIDDGQGWKTTGGAFPPCRPPRLEYDAPCGLGQVFHGAGAVAELKLHTGQERPRRPPCFHGISAASRGWCRGRFQSTRRPRTTLRPATPARWSTCPLSKDQPVVDYFKQFKGLDAGPRFNNEGFWDPPIPVTKDIDVGPDDVVIYDARGYEPLKKFLKEKKVRHVLLTGYATDMCFCKTTAGYQNLSKDFNVFLVGDATLATFPANLSPKCATNAAISFAAPDQLVTQISWIKYEGKK